MKKEVMKGKELKKVSFYVWFLGNEECTDLLDPSYVHPAVSRLLGKEKTVEPPKVTLQLNAKGMKMIQYIPRRSLYNRCDVSNKFIPHGAIKCVVQERYPNDDVISCIYLVPDEKEKAPIVVSSYRCDSAETALLLKEQFELFLELPEHQKTLASTENHMRMKGLLPYAKSCSDSRSTRDSLSSSSASQNDFSVKDERVLGLYYSLTSELKDRLHRNRSSGDPILLPLKDKTAFQKKNFSDSEFLVRKGDDFILSEDIYIDESRVEKCHSSSSRKSSGIGSDEPYSPCAGKASLKSERSQDVKVDAVSQISVGKCFLSTKKSSSTIENEVIKISSSRRPAESRQRWPSPSIVDSQPNYTVTSCQRKSQKATPDTKKAEPVAKKNPNKRWFFIRFRERFLDRFADVKRRSESKQSKSPYKEISSYVELGASERYPGLDRHCARLHYHSMLQLPEPRVTPLLERHDLPPRSARNYCAEPPSSQIFLIRSGGRV